MTKRMDFESLTLPLLKNLYLTALCVLENESQAQDVVEESLAHGYRDWLRRQGNPDVRANLFSILAHALMKMQGETVPDESDLSRVDEPATRDMQPSRLEHLLSESSTDWDLVPSLSSTDVLKALRELPDACRLLVVLSVLNGLSYQTIADLTGVQLMTVRSRLYHGRRLLTRGLWSMCVAIAGARDSRREPELEEWGDKRRLG